MKKLSLLVILMISIPFAPSCNVIKQGEANTSAIKALEKRIAALEERQRELLKELKIVNLKEKRFKRYARKSRRDQDKNLQEIAKLRKDIADIREKNRAFARVNNKLIDYSLRKSDEIKSLKRKFYRLWRLTMGEGKTFKEEAAVKPKEVKKETPPVKAPSKESEKSRKIRKKIQEGMV